MSRWFLPRYKIIWNIFYVPSHLLYVGFPHLAQLLIKFLVPFHHSSPHRLVALTGFPGRGILRWVPENNCLFQPESELHKISSSSCTALLEISCAFLRCLLCKRNEIFVLLPQRVLAPAHQYTAEDREAGAAIGLCPQETVSNCGTWVGAVTVSYVPAVVQKRTFLGQKESRMNSDVSQTQGIQQEQKHMHHVEETAWCWVQRTLSSGKAQVDDKLFSARPLRWISTLQGCYSALASSQSEQWVAHDQLEWLKPNHVRKHFICCPIHVS